MSVTSLSQRIAERRFSGTLSQVLKDRRGTSYRLFISTQGDRYSFKLYDGSLCVGEARCSWQEGGRMVLDDIAIANQVQPRPNPWVRFKQFVWDWEFEPVNYRQRGLGTALLASTVEHARKLGATVLQGEVFQPDVENTPGLLDWYERQGFVQSAPWPGQIDVLANITLELRSESAIARLGAIAQAGEESQLSSSSH